MAYATDLTDGQWALLEPVFNAPGKRGRKHAEDLRAVVNAMLYIAQTGCQWRYLPESFGAWTRVWSQFRRWSRTGTWVRALTVLHAAARAADGHAEAMPSMVVIDTHLARGASNVDVPRPRRPRSAVVSHYVARRRVELGLVHRQVSIPQTHLAGAEGEVDFGEFYATVAGVWIKCWM